MMHFRPSAYSAHTLGVAADVPATTTTATPVDYSQLLSQYGPTIAALVSGGKDPRERVALVQARINNYTRLRTTPPFSVVPGRAWYDAEIAKMKAILPALQSQAADATSVAQAKINVAGLTQGALVGLIAVASATTALLLALTVRTARRPV